MSAKPIEMLDAPNRQDWRKWLKEHHDSRSEIWLVFHKRQETKEKRLREAVNLLEAGNKLGLK